MECSFGISDFFEEIPSLSHSVVFLYFFALIAEEGFLRQQGLKGTQVGVEGEPQNSEEKEVTDPFWEQSQGSGPGPKAQVGGHYQQRETRRVRGTAETRIRGFTSQLPGEKGKQKTLILSVFPSRHLLNSEAMGGD